MGGWGGVLTCFFNKTRRRAKQSNAGKEAGKAKQRGQSTASRAKQSNATRAKQKVDIVIFTQKSQAFYAPNSLFSPVSASRKPHFARSSSSRHTMATYPPSI